MPGGSSRSRRKAKEVRQMTGLVLRKERSSGACLTSSIAGLGSEMLWPRL